MHPSILFADMDYSRNMPIEFLGHNDTNDVVCMT